MLNVTTMTMQIINGDPEGIKICRLQGKTMITIVIPRALLAEAKNLPDIPMRGIYYLLDDNKGRLKQVYAGQTTNGIKRLDSHNTQKEWWNKAVMFLAPDNEFSMDVVSGLESVAIAYIREHGAYQVANTVNPNPYVNPYTEAFIHSLHEDILTRMTLLGFNLDAVGDDDNAPTSGIFHTIRRGIQGLGEYDAQEGVFKVLSGSQIDLDRMPGTKERPYIKLCEMRSAMLAEGKILQDDQGVYRLQENVEFGTPSAASDFVLGGSSNGWTEWLNSEGKTLHEIYRAGDGNEYNR